MNKWFTIGIGIKRWVFLAFLGICMIGIGIASTILKLDTYTPLYISSINWMTIITLFIGGLTVLSFSVIKLYRNLLAPYRRHQQGRLIDVVYAHSKRHKGLRVVAIGGGTGLPSVLRGLKAYTNNITAVVTMADDGGSSGRLRRELGVLPPGDLRNNIAALADDEQLMTQLFQYRFAEGDLGGHSFGNLFIAAMAGVSGSLEVALTEVERVLNIQGRVLPSTLEDIHLIADVRVAGKNHPIRIEGESKIAEVNGQIEAIRIQPVEVMAYPESVKAILEADLVVIGPGSLFTSIIPNLLVSGIAQALKQTKAHKVYVCNVATQPGETDNFTVADHVMALERYIGRGIIQTIVANNANPTLNKGNNTRYVALTPTHHEIFQRYWVHYTDLTDEHQPWRHDPRKLANALLKIMALEKTGHGIAAIPVFEQL
ncbi:MAG: uridine diphosphate-N-acetylglucosamine-binding protein YvcK [Anaerolineae bacterium]|nr:uridine diphosphate-N-acetylglucosamine-binding protein YvcK [Anaerolineae bacterium]